MKQRLLLLVLLALTGTMLFGGSNSYAQGNRRGEPNVLSTGYYAVDSFDDSPQPWRPNYSFLDTVYQPFTWIRVKNGPRQFQLNPGNYFFFRPDQVANYNTMDTTNDCLAGPIPIGFSFNFYNQNYDSVTISSNGYIGFRPSSEGYQLFGGKPMYAERNDAAVFGSAYPSTAPSAIIAAIFGDLDMIPGNDSTKVYVRTSPSLDSFFVNFYNMRIRPSSPNNVEPGTGRDKLFSTKFQIVFTRSDSSIQINYAPFAGQIFTLPVVQAARVFQRNCTIGTMNENRTEWTSVNAGTHLGRGRWDAVANITCPTCNKDLRQSGQYAIKFVRWHNVVRAISVDFPTRNYEICLGTSVYPLATYQNVSLAQQTFKAKFQIRNTITGTFVYGRVFTLTNMLAGEKRTTKKADFPAYSTNPNILNQLGTFDACAVATSYDGADNYIGDRWPFDDTVCIRVFGIRTTALPFNDPNDHYNATIAYSLPDQTRWVSIGADVQDGDLFTYDPPPPRYESGSGVGPNQWLDPVIHFDRLDITGNPYNGQRTGDTLTSFPFNLNGQAKASIGFDYQRTGQHSFPLYWDGNTLIGPEKTITYASGQIAQVGDSMVIEIKNPAIYADACNPPSSAWVQVGAIDGGNDFEYKHFGIDLQQFNRAPSFTYLKNNFRFRLRLKANDNGAYPPDDDADDWFVDNIALQVPRKPEIEVMWVRVVTPYTHMPMSQMVSLPVYVHMSNNSSDVAIAFPVRVQILDPNQNTVYWKIQTVTSLRAGTDTTIVMPAWNALFAGQSGYFRVHAFLASSGYDTYTQDNGTFSDFYLDAGTPGAPAEFAYDDGGSDAPGTPLVDMSASGSGNASVVQNQPARGVGFHDLSGSLAMKFQTVAKDTLYGVRAFFASGNQQGDDIRITIFKGKPGSCVPSGDTVATGIMETTRQGQLFDQYWPYYFPKPIVLAPGIYWASVSQKGLSNYFLGADISRGGGRIVVTDPQIPVIPPIYNDPFGTNIGQDNNIGDISCAYALENVANSGNWSAWTPGSGFWPSMYPAAFGNYLNWGAYICNPCQAGWNAPLVWNYAGMYMPMIRTMVSQSVILPINLVYLNGKQDNGKALLTWATAWEKNNSGFFVERRHVGEADDFFEKLGFVNGKGNATTQTGYSFIDRNVAPGTYTYRLTQMDLDGSQHVSNSTNVEIDAPTNFSLEQNFPNPFNESTDISFTLPESAPTQVVVYNSIGQVVRTLVNGYVKAGTTSVKFDGRDDAGNELSSGAYLYKIVSGSYNAIQKMTLSK